MSNTPNPQPTVFVVDDDDDVRQSLVTLVHALGYRVRGFASFSEFESIYENDWAGCLILDVRLPDGSGISFYEQFLKNGNQLPVIFITAHANVTIAVAAMKTGAVEFLEKPFDRQALGERITRALSLDVQWRKQRSRYDEINERIAALSKTDLETLQLLIDGVPNKVMASRLGLTERAIELRRQRLMQRVGVNSVAELLDLAVTHRVLSEVRDVSRIRFLAE